MVTFGSEIAMETTKFLEDALADDGLYCIFASNKKIDRRVQKFFTSVADLVDSAKDLDNQGYDVYFALSTFKEDKSRKVDNVKYVKTFFLDLDCGPSKEFANQRDALTALQQFCKTNLLPRPTLINSGRGVHVYWVLKESVCLDDWLPVAERLKALCNKNKFLADPAVTADAARVLRVPKTHNYKPDDPVEVSFIGATDSVLVDFDSFSLLLGGDLIPVPAKRIEGANAMMHAALENQDFKFKRIVERSGMDKGCLQIYDALTKPNEVSEPIWRGMLSILKACSDGTRERAHQISKGYIGYDAEETDAKWDKLTSDKRYTCNKFEEHKPETCLACPNRAKFRSPLQLGKLIKEAVEEDNVVQEPALDLPNSPVNTYVIPKYPFPYLRGANGGVYLHTKDSEGNEDEKLIYRNDIYVVQRVIDPEIGEQIAIRLHLPKDGVREFTLPLTAVGAKDELRKQLAMRGVAVPFVDDLMKYLLTWINELQETTVAQKAHRQFGWVGDGVDAFVLGNQVITKDGVEFNPPSAQTAGLFPAFEPKGTLEEWKELMQFYNRPGFELHQYIICAGFGSILMHFMGGIACSAMHVHSKDSGLGKTTAMYASATIWGNPKQLVLDEQDTHNSKMLRSEILHNLPLYIDEMTNTSPEDLSTLAYQFTSGKQRARMVSGSNTERLRGEPWSLVAITTGNTSAIERISLRKENPSAEAQRILEVQADKIFKSPDTKEETDAFSAKLGKCYGHAGPIFIRYLMDNPDQIFPMIKEVQLRLDKEAAMASENRFWSAGGAVNVAGGIMAQRLGLIPYDMGGIAKFIVDRFKENKRRVGDMAVSLEQTLNEYINEHYDNILKIKSTSDLRKQDGSAMDSLIQPDAIPRGKMVARYETDVKKLYLIPKPFRIWCGKQQINYGSFVNELVKNMGAKRAKVRLGKGTHFQMKGQDVIIVQMGDDDEAGNTADV